MISKILIAIGIPLLLAGVLLTVFSKPIFSITHIEDQTQQVPKSETIMDYSFYINGQSSWAPPKVPFQCNHDQSLAISLTSNKKFNFFIANQQANGIEAIYFSRTNINSLTTTWQPTSDGSYYLKFTNVDFELNIHSEVTKTWTEPEVTDTVKVTEYKSLIDTNFVYLGTISLILGSIYSLSALLLPSARGKQTQKRQC